MQGPTELIAVLEQAPDPVEAVKTLVLAAGGTWVEPEPGIPGIAEIQLAGLVGIGPSLPAAVDDWLLQAQSAAEAHLPRSARHLRASFGP